MQAASILSLAASEIPCIVETAAHRKDTKLYCYIAMLKCSFRWEEVKLWMHSAMAAQQWKFSNGSSAMEVQQWKLSNGSSAMEPQRTSYTLH